MKCFCLKAKIKKAARSGAAFGKGFDKKSSGVENIIVKGIFPGALCGRP